MSNSENTQLTPVEGYDPKQRMIFSEPILGSVPDSKPKIEFKRINISSRNEDGSEGELVFPTERLFSFGVSENVSQETQKVTGYTFPLCLWSRDGPTKQEKQWTDTFDAVVEHCIDFLLSKKEELDMFELQRSDLTKSKGGLNPLYWKKEKVKDEATGRMVLRAVPDMGPTLYTKLIFSKKNDKFLTQFFNASDESEHLNALDLMGKYCYTNAAVKIESIFISGTGKISLQVKLYEAVVEPSKTGMKRLLARPKAKSMVIEAKNNKTISSVMEDNDSDDENGSLVGSEDNDLSVAIEKKVEKQLDKTKPSKRVVRKVITK
jgi:hypothetical protein